MGQWHTCSVPQRRVRGPIFYLAFECWQVISSRNVVLIPAAPRSSASLLRSEPTGGTEMTTQREIGYALLRLTFGVVFLFSGIGKFRGGIGNFAGNMLQQFSGKLLAVLVQPFAYVLPFAETILGALIVLGLFTPLALSFSGLLLVALTFGTVM